ncbi:MAG: hypothetical protein ACI86X_002046 [Moritella sp.]|jgi:hypothetical protein
MIMKYTFFNLAASAVLLTTSAVAFAGPISGQIDFSGNAVVTIANDQITEIDFANLGQQGSPIVGQASGDFLPTYGMSVDYIDPFVVSAPQAALWSVDGFTFDLTQILSNQSIDVNNNGTADYAIITGNGVIHNAGFDDTQGEWTFSTQGFGNLGNGGSFSFSATTVPEPAAIALLGLGLIGFGAARRKKQA